MPDSYQATLASRDELMRYHDPVRIQGYCASCDKHGQSWSCPPFAISPLISFPAWSHAVIVCGKVPTKPGAGKDDMIANFFEARKDFRRAMLGLELLDKGVTALVAGFCTGCRDCSRRQGQPCRTPSALRYSLEAVGFDVTGIAEHLAGQKLHWPKAGTPEYLMTVGALLCPSHEIADRLCTAIRTESVPAPSVG